MFASIEPSKPKQAKTDNNKEKSDIEENPKWTVVSEILEEIKVRIVMGYLQNYVIKKKKLLKGL